LTLSLGAFGATVPASAEYASARRKLDSIKENKAPAGSTVVFTRPEIEAWARVEIPKIVPQGFREPRVELAEGAATGRATVDFLKMRQAQGQQINWLMAKLIEGERPLVASIRLRSSGGWCTVDMTRVEISGVAATGSVLDFLVRTFFLSLYPDAKIGKPFELGYRMERIDIHPSGVAVRIWPNPAKQMAPGRPPTTGR
jgi:hypothetical protein